jgi:hypothetical protein
MLLHEPKKVVIIATFDGLFLANKKTAFQASDQPLSGSPALF